MSKSPPKKQPRLDEASAAEASTLTASAPVGSGASARQSIRADETEQKAAAVATAAWVESTTMPFPAGLPMEHEYDEREFYVRACYPKYYKIVLGLLKNKKTQVVTVTGTPGIGKSLFCAYFFKRYSFENEGTTIITASFNRRSDPEMMAVWKGGELLDSAKVRVGDSSDMSALEKKAEREASNKLIYLIDGPPKNRPVGMQSVVFTSPNEDWFRYIMKDWTRPRVIMPLWTAKELETAAIELDLTMSMAAVEPDDAPVAPMVADLIEQRFHIFGGVARACLSTDEQFVKDQQGSIGNIITMFKDTAELRALLARENEHEKMYHRICYFVPKDDNVREYTIAEPTPFVKQLLIESLRDLTRSQRKIIINLLKHNSAAASFRGSLFEMSVHDRLNSGCKFEARELGTEDSEQMQTFECAKSTPQVAGHAFCYFNENYSASVLSSGPYHVPASKRSPAVDSFYYEETPRMTGQAPLCLFQMTVAKSHPVKGAGVVAVLSKLGLLEKVIANPTRVALIFAVPLEMKQAFTRQTFVLDGILGDVDSVRKVRGIGAVTENALKEDPINVRTVGDLRSYLEENQHKAHKTRVVKGLSFGQLRQFLSQHDKAQEELDQGERGESSLKDVLESIPQFVWGVRTSEEENAEKN